MDANQTALAYQRETAWGVLAAPALKALRFTKESFEHEKQIVKSGEIRADRQQGESVEVGVNGKGGFDFELSTDFDAFLESALMGTYADLEGVPTLRNGAVRTSYLFEKKFTGINHIAFRGMMLDTMTLNLNAKQIITGSVEFIGRLGEEAVASLDANAAYDAAGTAPILSASTNVAELKADGQPLAGVRSLTLTTNNNLRGNDAIAVKSIDEVGLGSLLVTGKLEAYFRTRELVDRFMKHTTSSLSFEVSREKAGAVAGDHIGYRFTVPALKFTKGMPMVGGKDTDVMLPLEFEAEVGLIETDAVTIQVEKLLKAA